MKRKRDSSGTTLLEILLSIGTASLLLLTLVLLFTHSQKIFFGEGNASEELRSLGTAMQTLSDKLSTESVYLVRVNHNFLLGEPSSKAETHAPLQRTYSTFSSPLQSYSCRITKFKLYAQFKIPYYWIVDPMEKRVVGLNKAHPS